MKHSPPYTVARGDGSSNVVRVATGAIIATHQDQGDTQYHAFTRNCVALGPQVMGRASE